MTDTHLWQQGHHPSKTLKRPGRRTLIIVSSWTLVVLLLPPTPLRAQTATVDSAAEIARLHAVLQSGASRFEKITACKRLAAIGASQSVPLLASMLGDEQLSHAARIGLEAITDPSAAAALRDAVPNLEGELLVGTVNSIGARRDQEAVTVLAELLNGKQAPQVFAAAAIALGKIATPSAVQELLKALESAPEIGRTALGQGCLMAADNNLREGNLDAAVAICDRLLETSLPAHLRLSAQRVALLARKPLDTDRLARLLSADSDDAFAMALIVAREFPGNDITRVLTQHLAQLPVDRQALLITLLGDRGDTSALPAVLKSAESDHVSLRVSAIRALGRLGNASVVPLLLNAAGEPDEAVADAARNALVLMNDPAVDQQILRGAEGNRGASLVLFYDLIGRRRIVDGVPLLLQGADGNDLATRLAAIRALGKTIPATQLDTLTQRLISATNPDELAAVKEALQTSCIRLADSETCARKIVACLPKTSGELRHSLYDLLGIVGGSTALEAMAKASAESDPELQDTVTRVLGQWMSPDAAPVLLEIASQSDQEKFRIRALRGYMRIVRQFDVPSGQRVVMCRQAMSLAERKEEKLLVLETLPRMPSAESLSIAVSQLESTEVKRQAALVTLALSDTVVNHDPAAVVAAMEQLLKLPQSTDVQKRAQAMLAQAQAKQNGP